MASARLMRKWSSGKALLDVSTIASTARSSTWTSPKTGSSGKGVSRSKRPFAVRAPQDRSCRRWGRHRVFVPHHKSCDGHLDVSGLASGVAGRISQVAAEPRFEGADWQKIIGLVRKITEPVLGHARPDDLPLEALVVDLQEVEAISDVSQIEPKRVSVLEQDTFQPWCVQQACMMIQSLFFILTATVTDESVSVVLRHRKSSGCESLRSCVRRQNSEQTSSCHSTGACPPLHGIGSKMEACFSSFTIVAVWRES